jgi:hypothetical protein
MLLPYCDVALPHTLSISYSCQPATREESDSDDTSAQTTQTTSPSTIDPEYKFLDEEAQCGFWDLDSIPNVNSAAHIQVAKSRKRGLFHRLYDFWSFICVVAIASCAVLLGFDLALGQYGIGMGLTGCIIGMHLPPPPMGDEVSVYRGLSSFITLA